MCWKVCDKHVMDNINSPKKRKKKERERSPVTGPLSNYDGSKGESQVTTAVSQFRCSFEDGLRHSETQRLFVFTLQNLKGQFAISIRYTFCEIQRIFPHGRPTDSRYCTVNVVHVEKNESCCVSERNIFAIRPL